MHTGLYPASYAANASATARSFRQHLLLLYAVHEGLTQPALIWYNRMRPSGFPGMSCPSRDFRCCQLHLLWAKLRFEAWRNTCQPSQRIKALTSYGVHFIYLPFI